MFRHFLRELGSDWVALVSGIASFAACFASAEFSQAFPPWLFFPVAYVCLAFAAYRLWAKEYGARERAEELLRGNGLATERRREAEALLAKLSEAERAVVRKVLVMGRMNESQLRACLRESGFGLVNVDLLAQRTGFLLRDGIGDFRINPEFALVLREALIP